MKKVLLVLALVAVYALSVTTASANVVILDKTDVTVVADDKATPAVEKEVKKATKAEAKKAEAKVETKGTACGDAAKTEAKAECAEGEKKAACCSTAAAKECDEKK